MIRVLQVVTSMDVGGIETLLMNLYRHIDRTLIQFDFLLHRQQETFFEKEIMALGGEIYRVPPIDPFHHHAYLKALDTFFAEHMEYKIIHAHNNAFSMYVLRAAKRAGIPVCIAHSHTAHVPFDIKRTVFYNYCSMKISRYTDYSFACSLDSGNWLFGKSITENERFHVMHNGIDCDKFSFSTSTRQEARKQLNIQDQLLIGHIGSFIQYKNHPFLLRIFNALLQSHPNAILMLVGDGQLRKVIEQQALNMNLYNKVKFLGVRSDVAQLMQAMDLLLFPSLFEGLGIVLIEAQAAGLPCLASDRVPKEAKVTDLLEHMPLEESPEHWSQKAFQMMKDNTRRDRSAEIKAAGYDIDETSRWLQDFYLTRYAKAIGNWT